MATIPMTSGFTVCPAGKHIFRIYDCTYNADFGKVEVKLVNAQGITHTERFSLMGQGGVMNEGACNAFSYFAKTALNDFTLEEIDHTWLIDRYIGAEVTHTVQPNKNDPTKNITFANLGDKWVAECFDTPAVEKALTLGHEPVAEAPAVAPAPAPAAPAAQPTTASALDLTALLK